MLMSTLAMTKASSLLLPIPAGYIVIIVHKSVFHTRCRIVIHGEMYASALKLSSLCGYAHRLSMRSLKREYSSFAYHSNHAGSPEDHMQRQLLQTKDVGNIYRRRWRCP